MPDPVSGTLPHLCGFLRTWGRSFSPNCDPTRRSTSCGSSCAASAIWPTTVNSVAAGDWRGVVQGSLPFWGSGQPAHLRSSASGLPRTDGAFELRSRSHPDRASSPLGSTGARGSSRRQARLALGIRKRPLARFPREHGGNCRCRPERQVHPLDVIASETPLALRALAMRRQEKYLPGQLFTCASLANNVFVVACVQ